MRVLAKHKYNARRVVEDGYSFPSKMEHTRYCDLRLLQRAGMITELEVHPRYEIVWPGEMKRLCIVELDFRYRDKKSVVHVEDVKGFLTALSTLKRKLVEAAHKITVEIIR